MFAKLIPLSFAVPIRQVLPALSVGLAACAQAVPAPPSAFGGLETLPPIRTVMTCLPKEAALIAAHRGTSESFLEPENSISALEKLIDHGTMMAEIDIAAIKDGTPIIFHDGVWDDHASGTGPVVATSAEDFATLRLKDARGSIGGEAVPTLADYLDAAKDRIYLEIDFKSSSDMNRVIEMIHARDMVDQVVLIATNDDEAEALMPYADEFLMSLPRAPKRTSGQARQGVWIGGGWRDGEERPLGNRHYVIGAQWQKKPSELVKAARALDILVTDQAKRYRAVEGLEKTGAFRACLRKDR